MIESSREPEQTSARSGGGELASGARPVALTDDDGRILRIDAAFERVFGLTPADAGGALLAELVIAPRFRAAYRALLRELVAVADATAVQRSGEFSVLGADGGELPAELSIGRTGEDPGRITTQFHAAGDREVEHAKGSGATEFQRRVEELAGIGTWQLEHRTGELAWSDNLFRLVGLEPRSVVPSFDYLGSQAHRDDRERVLRAREELRRTGRLAPLRFRLATPDGRLRHLQLVTSLVSGTRGGSDGGHTYGIVRDVTEQRIAEQELAARLAVTDRLANWQSGDGELRHLLRDLAEPLDFEVGALWIREGDARVVRATWQARAFARPDLDRRMRDSRRPLKAGMVGAAWQTGRPVSAVAMPHNAERVARLEGDLQGTLALPATFDGEVLAVLSLASRDKVELGGRLLRSLAGAGHEIGHFFARRRGELSANPLTPRELEVLQLLARGGSRSQIAGRLHVSESTIKTHLEHIYAKLDAHDRAAAVGVAMRQGLIT